MTRTFSKVYGLAALRLGWIYAPAACGRRDQPDAPAVQRQCAGAGGRLAALEDIAHIAAASRTTISGCPGSRRQIAALGLNSTPSVGNFLLCAFRDAAAAAARRRLR